jgi:hypothetical protein
MGVDGYLKRKKRIVEEGKMVLQLTDEEHGLFSEAKEVVENERRGTYRDMVQGDQRAGDVFEFWNHLYYDHMSNSDGADFYFDPSYTGMILDQKFETLAEALYGIEIASKVEDFYQPGVGMTRAQDYTQLVEDQRRRREEWRRETKITLERRLRGRVAIVEDLDDLEMEFFMATNVPVEYQYLGPFRTRAIERIEGNKNYEQQLAGPKAAAAVQLFEHVLEYLASSRQDQPNVVRMVLNKKFKRLANYFRTTSEVRAMDTEELVDYLTDNYGPPVKGDVPVKIFRKQQRLNNLDTEYPYLKVVQKELDDVPDDDEDTRNAILNSVLDEMEKVETSASLPATVSVVDEVFRRHVT